jgi:hypothetical protein
MEGIIWTDLVKNAEVLQKIKEERNVQQNMKKESKLCWSNLAWELPSKTYY